MEEYLRRLVVNAVYLLTGLDERVPEKSNVGTVGEYEPSATRALSDKEWAENGLRAGSCSQTHRHGKHSTKKLDREAGTAQ